MSDDELTALFRTELNSDIGDLKTWIDAAEIPEIRSFAHKYKVRLQYLGYSDSYELCLNIERYYKSEVFEALLEDAGKLYDRLALIQQNAG